MVDVEYLKTSKLVVHHIYKMPIEELIRNRISPEGTRALYWCDGIVFSISFVPDTQEVIKEYIVGKEHWDAVFYSELVEYQPILELDDPNYRGVKVRVINATDFSPHKEFVQWLKKK